MNNESIQFCNNWLGKAKLYTEDNLEHNFDKFFTLFVVYNRLYAEVTFKLSRKGEINLEKRTTFPDAQAAKDYVEKYLKSSFINTEITKDENCTKALASLKEIIRNKIFWIKLDMVTGEPDPEKDKVLLNDLESNYTSKKVKAILDIIYSIRCNVFHAQKGYDEDQKVILRSINILLKKIIDLLFEKLKNE